MSDCLKLQLKGTVNNDSLPIFNAFVLTSKQMTASPATTLYWKLVLKGTVSVTIKAADSTGYFATSIANLTGDPKTEASGTSLTLYFPNIAARYIVSGKFDISELTWEPCTDTGARPNLTNVTITNADTINAADLEGIPIQNLSLFMSGYGDLMKLKNLPIGNTKMFYVAFCNFANNADVEYLPKTAKEYYIQNSNIGGNIASVGQFSKATIFNCSNEVAGTIESLVAAFENNAARTTKSITISSLISGLVTFGSYQMKWATLGATSATLSWSSTSKMAMVSTGYAYTKGYTAEEAASAFSGKTVVRVDA